MQIKNKGNLDYCLRCKDRIDQGDHKYGLHTKCFVTWFKAAPEDEFLSLKQQSSISQSPDMKSKNSADHTSFFHGKFKKYSAELAGASFILKMRQNDAPELPEVEYVCNQIGNAIGLAMAEHFLINFLGDQVFVTRNFIKKGGASSTLDHIYKYLKEGQDYDCAQLIKIISQQTKKPLYLETFIHTVLFDALIGNHDRHGRNLGFIVMASTVVLSPIYDSVSYLGLEHGKMLLADFEPAGKIAVKGDLEPSMKEYVQEFKRLGYEETTRAFHSKIKLTKVIELISNSFCSDLMKTALERMVTKRHKELEDALA